MARVAGLVLVLFGLGVFSQTGYLFVVSLLLGGNTETIVPLLGTDIKGGNSLTGLDYRIFRSGSGPSVEWADVVWMPRKSCPFPFLMHTGCCRWLMEEFQNVLLSYRLRGNAPDSKA